MSRQRVRCRPGGRAARRWLVTALVLAVAVAGLLTSGLSTPSGATAQVTPAAGSSTPAGSGTTGGSGSAATAATGPSVAAPSISPTGTQPALATAPSTAPLVTPSATTAADGSRTTPAATAPKAVVPQPGPQVAQPAPVPGTTAYTRTLTVGGLQRSYLVVAPTHPSGTLPLLVVLHGVNATPAGEVQRDQFAPLVARDEMILVYPAGYEQSWNAGVDGCCGAAGALHIDDLSFLAQLVAVAEATLPVRSGQVYLVGFSNGGKLAYDVMCSEPALFDAFVAVGATPLAACTAKAQPAVSMMVTAGADDPELPISDRAEPAAKAVAGAAATWRARDGCGPASSTVAVDAATITTWSSCTGGTQVRSVLYRGLAHYFPSSTLVGSADSGATLIWQFLSAQPTAAAG